MAVCEVSNNLEDYRRLIANFTAKIKQGELSYLEELTKSVDDTIALIKSYHDDSLTNVVAIIDSLKETIKLFPSVSDHTLSKKLERLESRVKTLEEKVETMEASLIIGQICLKVEQAVKRLLFEGTGVEKRKYSYLNLLDIQNAIYDQNSHLSKKLFPLDEERLHAMKQLEELEKSLNIDFAVFNATKELKTQRNIVAHPNKSIAEAHEFLQKALYIRKEDQEMSLELLEILRHMGITNLQT